MDKLFVVYKTMPPLLYLFICKKKEQGEKIGKEGNRYNISWMTAAETCKRDAGRLEDQRTIKDSLF